MIATEDPEVSGIYSMTMKMKIYLARPTVSVVLPVLTLEHLRTSSKTLLRRTSRTKMDCNKTMMMSMFSESPAET